MSEVPQLPGAHVPVTTNTAQPNSKETRLIRRQPNPQQKKALLDLRLLLSANDHGQVIEVACSGRKNLRLLSRLQELATAVDALGLSTGPYATGHQGAQVKTDNSKHPQLSPFTNLNADRLKISGRGQWDAASYMPPLFQMSYLEPQLLELDEPVFTRGKPNLGLDKPEEVMKLFKRWDEICITDRSDYYHQMGVTLERSRSNLVWPSFSLGSFKGFRAYKDYLARATNKKKPPDRNVHGDGLHGVRPAAFGVEDETPIFGGFKSVLQGDHLGVEYGIVAHAGFLEAHGLLHRNDRLQTSTLIRPRGLYEGLVIDDYFAIAPVPVEQLKSHNYAPSKAFGAFKKAKEAYSGAGLAGSDAKDVIDEVCAAVIGAEVDSRYELASQGLLPVGAPAAKRMSLSWIALSAAKLPYTSDAVHSSLLGALVSAFCFRRCGMALLQHLFKIIPPEELDSEKPVLRLLPRKAADELVLGAVLLPIMVLNVKAEVSQTIFSTDASNLKGAVCEASIPKKVAEALWQSGDFKGGHTVLESLPKSLLKSHGGFEEEDWRAELEDFGDPFETSPVPSLGQQLVFSDESRALVRATRPLEFGRPVQDVTRSNRQKLLKSFADWLEERGVSFDFLLGISPKEPEQLVSWLVHFGRDLYQSGRPYSHYAETLNAIGSCQPAVRRLLSGAWDLAFSWLREEPYEHHTACPYQIMLAAVSLSIMWGWPRVAGALALSWGAICRIGEVVSATRADLVLPVDTDGSLWTVMLRVGEPKTRFRAARHQLARLDWEDLVGGATHLMLITEDSELVRRCAARWKSCRIVTCQVKPGIISLQDGLGRESAVRLARAGARVVLTTRSEAKGVQAVEQVTLDAPSGPGVSRKNS
ncbi:Uncharacterized protein SCF082_LOCUS1929 [Durusdinium trenchii]|uniref:Uncharacterized protein n=1 Tax=Durusdinium trenchii TaxID=1381693 RepID=A0ABP0HHM8_9DINO